MELVDKIWIINMKNAGSKRKILEKQIRGLDFSYDFFEAVDGNGLREIEFEVVNEWKEPFTKKQITKGEIGCALSHHQLWGKVPEGKYIVILEDDINLDKEFESSLVTYMNHFKSNPMDFCFLNRKPYHKEEKIINYNPRVISPKYSHWACAYLLSYEGAQKLLNVDYVHKIIPVDEFIPIMYGESYLDKYKKYYEPRNLVAYATEPQIIRLQDDAFNNSSTVKSSPYIKESNESFEVWGIGSEATCGRNRFEKFCDVYGLKYKIIGDGVEWKMDMSKGPGGGQKVNILKKTLQERLKSNPKDDGVILVTDTYDVIPLSNTNIILEKYKKLSNGGKYVIFSAEKTCWPNKDLADKYPYVRTGLPRFLNSGGFIGKKSQILEMCQDDIVSDWDDDQEYWSLKFLNDNKIKLDIKSEIFQTLNESYDDVDIDYRKSVIKNNVTKTNPCILHGNGPITVKLKLNSISNYCGNNWNYNYGYIDEYKYRGLKSDKKIYIALFGQNDAEKLIEQYLDYPKELLTVRLYGKKLSSVLGQKSINDFLKSDADFYFSWETDNVEITDRKLLQKLVFKTEAKGVIAPFVRRKGKTWSNFWGAVNNKGYYRRSDDYFDILDGDKKGIWNVPYITDIFMISRDIANQQLYDGSGDPDMVICKNLRNKGIFMYVDNLDDYGYFFEDGHERLTTGEITIYDYKRNKQKWVEKYMDPEYLKNKENIDKKELCSDAYLFQMFKPEFCEELIREVEKYGNWSRGGDSYVDPRISNLEPYPTQDIHLNQFGFGEVWQQIVFDHFAPLASQIFSPYKTKGVNISFIVRYHPKGQKELKAHHDSSTYTLNIALNKCGVDYEGGGFNFLRQNVEIVNQPVGSVAIHPGKLTHYHRGLPTTKGTRYILVTFVN